MVKKKIKCNCNLSGYKSSKHICYSIVPKKILNSFINNENISEDNPNNIFDINLCRNSKQKRQINTWREGYGNNILSNIKSSGRPKISQLERPGGYTVITPIKNVYN